MTFACCQTSFISNHAAAAAKLLQLCPTLCDPIDGSPPGAPVPGILQAKTLEWVGISFSSAWKWKVKVNLLSRVWLFKTPWSVAYQAPPSMGFSRQEYWSGMPLPSPYQTIEYIYFMLDFFHSIFFFVKFYPDSLFILNTVWYSNVQICHCLCILLLWYIWVVSDLKLLKCWYECSYTCLSDYICTCILSWIYRRSEITKSWKWSHEVKSLSLVWLFATPWTVAYQAPPSLGFSRQEYWSGLPFPSPGDLPNPGIEPGSPTLQADALPSEPPGKLIHMY